MEDGATEPRVCANCKTPLQGEYCHHCGQRDKDYLRNVLGLVADFVQELSEWDSRFWRSLVPLMFRPGFLSNEWVAGRRMHYVSPVRLYIFISIAFFLVFAMVTDEGMFQVGAEPDAVEEAAGPRVEIDDDDISVDIPFLSETERERVKAQIIKLKNDPRLAFRQAMSLAPQMMFLLMPVFAFVLKVLYLFSRRYYTEHLLLAIHTHSFMFLSFLALFALSGLGAWAQDADAPLRWIGVPVAVLTVAAWIWIPTYLFLAQKRFYRQGWFMTSIKYFLTGFIYFFMLVFALAGLGIATILTA